jgi:hypothetical protein
LRHVKVQGRAGDVFGFGGGDKVTQMAQLHARASIAIGYSESRNTIFLRVLPPCELGA